jgi:rhodanese-related sulfurtransferase
MNNKLWLLFVTGLFLISACSGGGGLMGTAGDQVVVDQGTYTNLDPDELAAMMEEEDFALINVHIPFEGDLPETDAFIPFNEVEAHLDKLPEDKDAKVVLYCRSGNMSRTASETLLDLGYTNVWNLEGGFKAWQAAGYPMAGE